MHQLRVFIGLGAFASAFLTSFGVPMTATAQELPANSNVIVVTAKLDDPASDEVREGQSIAMPEVTSLSPVSAIDSLSFVPGVIAFEKGGVGTSSYLSVRGGEPNFTLVTINGVRVNDPLQTAGGGFDFSLVDPYSIASIDVLSAPLSTAYGADALSGVVALEIGQSEENNGSLRAGYGSGDRYDLSAHLQLSGVGIGLSQSDTRSFNAGSSAKRRSAFVTASPKLADAFSLDLVALISENNSVGFPEDSGGPLLAVLDDQEFRERDLVVLGGTVAVQANEQIAFQLRSGWTRSELTSVSPGIAPGVLDGVPPITSDSRFDRFETVASLSANLAANINLTIGGSYTREDGRATGTLDFGFIIPTDFSLKRETPGLFAGVEIGDAEGPNVKAGLRVDWPDSGSARWTPRIGGELPLGMSGLRLEASYARGFKQPSLFALGFPLLANPDLNDELSETGDVGFAWKSGDGNAQLSLTAFRSTYRDLIDFEPALFTNVNRSRVDAEGLELAGSARLGAVELIGALTHQSVESRDGSPLRFRPDWTGRIATQWAASERLSLRLDAEFIDDFLDSSIPTGQQRVEGFATIGTQVNFALANGLELSAAVRNLTDENYQRTIGTPERGRNAYISIAKRF